MVADATTYRFTVDAYHRMADSGILTEDDRVELIDGEIVIMSPVSGSHVACVARVNTLLARHAAADTIVSAQSPVRLSEYHEPEPDVVLLRNRTYGDELPGPDDVLLLIEVANTSLAYDRGTKLPLYALAGIAEVWIVDLQGMAIERHTNPVGSTYQMMVRVGQDEAIESTIVPGLVVDAKDVLG